MHQVTSPALHTCLIIPCWRSGSVKIITGRLEKLLTQHAPTSPSSPHPTCKVQLLAPCAWTHHSISCLYVPLSSPNVPPCFICCINLTPSICRYTLVLSLPVTRWLHVASTPQPIHMSRHVNTSHKACHMQHFTPLAHT